MRHMFLAAIVLLRVGSLSTSFVQEITRQIMFRAITLKGGSMQIMLWYHCIVLYVHSMRVQNMFIHTNFKWASLRNFFFLEKDINID
jgi:hypothetical protein